MSVSRIALVSAVAATTALALALSGSGRGSEPAGSVDERAGWPIYRDVRWGYRVRFPGSWYRATEPVAPKLTEPREILSLATFPLRYRPTDCEAFAGAARSELGRNDVFLTIQERGYDRDSNWPDFPPRPVRFGPTDPRPAEKGCGDLSGTTVHWRNFADAGRHFHVLVAIGTKAPASVREQAWQILDSLRLDPNRTPTWPASG